MYLYECTLTLRGNSYVKQNNYRKNYLHMMSL